MGDSECHFFRDFRVFRGCIFRVVLTCCVIARQSTILDFDDGQASFPSAIRPRRMDN